MKASVIFILFFITSSNAAEPLKHEKILMADGRSAETCMEYNSMRSEIALDESVSNMILSSEYLECAYEFSAGPIDTSDKFIDRFYSDFDISKIPLSIAQEIEAGTTLKTLKSKLDRKNQRISFGNSRRNLVFTFERKTKDGYLIFIIDEIFDGNYRAYFPAEVVEKNNSIQVRPIYKSGW